MKTELQAIYDNAIKIVYLIDSPHWETKRKERIRDLALAIQALAIAANPQKRNKVRFKY